MIQTRRSAMSLRTGLLITTSLTVLPLVLSAVLGYFLLNQTVMADYRDVVDRQHKQIDPLRRLQVALLQAEQPLLEYLATGKQDPLVLRRTLLADIETDFVQLSAQLRTDKALSTLLSRARADWENLGQAETDLVAFKASDAPTQQSEALSRFNSFQSAAANKLGALHSLIEAKVTHDYQDAALGYERSKWLAGIAAGITLLFMVSGIVMFTRSIVSSIERLVHGVELFASGSRNHVIEVHVPRELNRVAEEFNKMIKVIEVSEGKLADQARRDELTGLLNRRAFDESMATAYARLRRHGETTALVALDIDHFKRINDTYGHAAGDLVLTAVAGTVRNCVRSIDAVFRCGGEEFSVLLPGADTTAAHVTAERIRAAVEGLAVHVDDKLLTVTVSLGIALATTAADGQPVALQRRADLALYQAKASGRNRVVAA